MAFGGTGSHQNPYKLLLLEIFLHLLAAGLLYLHLSSLPDPNQRYGIILVLGVAILLRAIASLVSESDSLVTGNFGKPAGFFQVITALLLGLAWGLQLPLLMHWETTDSALLVALPIAISVSALAVFSGSALNTRLLLVFVFPALLIPVGLLAFQEQYDRLLNWGLITLALLALSRSSSGLDEIIERFLQVSRGNTELVKNLAKTRDAAISSKEAAENARQAMVEEIAEREKAEKKIKASERELSRILDDMMDTYFQVGEDGALQRISPSVELMLGYSREDACHKSWAELFASQDDYQAFLNALDNSFGTLQNYEARLQHQMEHDVWVTLNAHYREGPQGHHEGFEGIARDTTKERNSKETLFQEKELWRVTLESIIDGVITTDIKGQVSFLNPIAEKMTGWTSALAQGKPLSSVMNLLDESGQEPVTVPMQAWLKDGQQAKLADPALLIRHGDGAQAAIELSGSPIRDSQAQIIGSVMVFHDVTKLRALAMQLTHQATHDALTGLINRVEFDARVEQAIHSANQHEKQHSLFYLDLDQFKIVNDTCGHPAGDELLKQVTRLLRGGLREADVLARLGGDEFGVLLLGCPLDKAEIIAEKMRKAVEDFRFWSDGNEFRIGASIGVVPILDSGTPLTELMKAVDSACYVAKEQGRNRVHVSRPDDKEIAVHHGQMQWMQRIQRAVEEDAFVLYSQPIVSIEKQPGQGRHAELLLRMVENKGTEQEKIIPPAAFLPAAERYHLMPLIDRWVLEKALHLLASGDAEVRQLTTCSLNLSGQSLTDLKLYDYILKLLEETKVNPKRICFEITESAVIANMEVARQFVNGLRKIGCRFALDDFGSGLSTFDYLKQLEVDYVKLDGSLVRDVATSRVSQAMVHAVNYVTHVMGMKTIAEFVESEQIMQALRKLSVDYAQGYAIGKPAPVDR
jgi:diguanylate cyclase (GGDEF)-like protein/PAS domain S-box-containing protein